MIRFLLLSILLTILFRAASHLWAGVVRGLKGGAAEPLRASGRSGPPQRGVQMARDPVCGTFVVPANAVALSTSDGQRLFFCSTTCRDNYRARPTSSPAAAHGRTA
jgi:YHS domain-containing protein